MRERKEKVNERKKKEKISEKKMRDEEREKKQQKMNKALGFNSCKMSPPCLSRMTRKWFLLCDSSKWEKSCGA